MGSSKSRDHLFLESPDFPDLNVHLLALLRHYGVRSRETEAVPPNSRAIADRSETVEGEDPEDYSPWRSDMGERGVFESGTVEILDTAQWDENPL